MILINDAQVIAIPVIERQEKFCDLAQIDARIKVDSSMSQIASSSAFFSYSRVEIAEKLKESVCFLPAGINYYIKEAYRPLSQQKESFQNVLNHYKKIYTGLTDDEIYTETCKYVAPPEYAPHPTGAAIDITLISENNMELNLGTEFNATPHETNNATYFHSDKISEETKNNRKILHDALIKVGFVNYEPEWWHWSIGDRYWAFNKNITSGKYGVVEEEWIKENITIKCN